MRKTVATAMLLAVLTATVPAAAQDDPARQGAFTRPTSPNPDPVVVSFIDPATAAEGTAGIVANPELLTPIVAPAQVAAPTPGISAPAVSGTGDAAATPEVMSFTVPVPIPAAMTYQYQPGRYPQQDQQMLQQQAYQRQLYEERLRQYQMQQQEYARQYAARQQQLAEQQQQLQQQLQILAQQQQQIAARAEAVRQESLALQRQPVAGQPFDPALPFAPVRQFDPNAPIPPQPPMLLPPAPPSPYFPPAQPRFAPPAAGPLPAEDFVNTLRNPSQGGDNPVLSLITPAEVKQALRQGVQLVMLDVRDAVARDVEGIIPGAVSVPYEPAATFAARVAQVIPRGNFPVVVFCSDGTASAKATEVAARMGYSAYLMGAYRLWVDVPRQPLAALPN